MRIEVDVHAAERRAPLVVREAPGFRLHAVDAGALVWVGLEVRREAAGALDPRALADALRAAGVAAAALLADPWFVGGEGAPPPLAALEQAGLVTDPGAAAGVTLPAGVVALGELTFAGGAVETIATAAHPGIALFARRGARHFWIAARSLAPAPSLVEETTAIMAAISGTMSAPAWR